MALIEGMIINIRFYMCVRVLVFAALVKSTMESLQHIDHLGVHLKVSK